MAAGEGATQELVGGGRGFSLTCTLTSVFSTTHDLFLKFLWTLFPLPNCLSHLLQIWFN